ncbi:MAG: hypothetical protein O3A46_16045 [Candidatus Poribacteria bacterium]|nr:hypothetical protein [Candidatus Poribacteria bacterium]
MTNDFPTPDAPSPLDRCAANLRVLYDAIVGHQRATGRLPMWLSDLFPRYLDDASVLSCPAAGKNGSANIHDPKMPCNYDYQFAPLPLHRSLKWEQLRTMGTLIPVVRCWHHAESERAILNISYDGGTYRSSGTWERDVEEIKRQLKDASQPMPHLKIPVELKIAWWLLERV